MVSPSMPDSSVASRSAAATMSASPSSQCPPSCTHRPSRGCRVSSVSRAGVVEHQRRGGDVARHACRCGRRRGGRVRSRVRRDATSPVPGSGASQSVSVRRPTVGHRIAACASAHRDRLHFAQPVGRATGIGRLDRIAGPAGSAGWPIATAPSGLPVRGQVELAAHQVLGEDRRSDPAAADSSHGQRHQQGLHCGAGGDREHGVLGGGPGGVGIGVRAVGHHERDDEFRCVVEDLSAPDAPLDGVGRPSVTGQVGAPLVLHRGRAAGSGCRRRGPRRTAPAGCGVGRAPSVPRPPPPRPERGRRVRG